VLESRFATSTSLVVVCTTAHCLVCVERFRACVDLYILPVALLFATLRSRHSYRGVRYSLSLACHQCVVFVIRLRRFFLLTMPQVSRLTLGFLFGFLSSIVRLCVVAKVLASGVAS
jgi:hypothetical protein